MDGVDNSEIKSHSNEVVSLSRRSCGQAKEVIEKGGPCRAVQGTEDVGNRLCYFVLDGKTVRCRTEIVRL